MYIFSISFPLFFLIFHDLWHGEGNYFLTLGSFFSSIKLFHYYTSLLQITFSPALSREFGPYKPDPAPLLHICSAWEVLPDEVIMVGDSLKDDVSGSFPDFLSIHDIYLVAHW